MRRQHWLRSNRGTAALHSVVWTDTETWPDRAEDGTIRHRLRFGWAVYQRTREAGHWTEPEWERYETAGDFWTFVEDRTRVRTRTYVFAHNWSFDACVLNAFDFLPQRGWKLSKAVIESPPVILSWRRERSSILMLDTLNWWRMPLAKIGESLGLPKLAMPAEGASAEEWDVYCRQDVEIIRRAIHAWCGFLKDHDLGDFAPTLASQALRAFRHRFMDHPILIDDDPEALTLARASLHGGRTECFRLGRVQGPIHCLDVTSMYPSVMLENDYPTVLRLYATDPDMAELRRWTEGHAVVARVVLDSKTPRYAHWTGDKLLFPVGRYQECLTTPDLRIALTHGEILSCTEAAVYDRAPVFARYVRELFDCRADLILREESVQAWLLKILLNALYGKFAQSGAVWENVGPAESADVRIWQEVDAETGQVWSYRQFGGIVQTKLREPESHDSHPAVAAHVTAYARAALWGFIERAGRKNVVYVDTDSLFVLGGGLDRLASFLGTAELGKLKLEGTYPEGVFHGPKDYQLGSVRKCKGIRPGARPVGEGLWEQEQWSSLRGLIHTGDLGAPVTRTVVKSLKRTYDKGLVLRDGLVLPLTLSRG